MKLRFCNAKLTWLYDAYRNCKFPRRCRKILSLWFFFPLALIFLPTKDNRRRRSRRAVSKVWASQSRHPPFWTPRRHWGRGWDPKRGLNAWTLRNDCIERHRDLVVRDLLTTQSIRLYIRGELSWSGWNAKIMLIRSYSATRRVDLSAEYYGFHFFSI